MGRSQKSAKKSSDTQELWKREWVGPRGCYGSKLWRRENAGRQPVKRIPVDTQKGQA